MKTALTVIVCSHNPNPDYLRRVLAALRAQTLAFENWELLLIDNASKKPFAHDFPLGWHPQARHLREDAVGKINALLLGFREASGDIRVIVDDDNILAPDYLENVLSIAIAHPDLGAWGGNVILKFEKEPPQWTERYWPFLAQRTVNEDVLSVGSRSLGQLPVGAGCCVRRQVTEAYAAQIQSSSKRKSLGRSGDNLMSGEDTDLVLTAVDVGLGCGLFKTLQLDHLMPPHRLTEDYLVRLVKGIQFSSLILEMSRDRTMAPPRTDWRWWLSFYCDCAVKFGRKRRFYIANKTAQRKAREIYDQRDVSS